MKIESLELILESLAKGYVLKPSKVELHLSRQSEDIFICDFSTYWYCDEVLHRVDGPAVVSKDGTEEWFFNGLRHRDDGPAIIHPKRSCRYYHHGNEIYHED